MFWPLSSQIASKLPETGVICNINYFFFLYRRKLCLSSVSELRHAHKSKFRTSFGREKKPTCRWILFSLLLFGSFMLLLHFKTFAQKEKMRPWRLEEEKRLLFIQNISPFLIGFQSPANSR